MQSTRHSWLSAAQGAGWFRLTRHDDPDPADPPEPQPEGDPAPDPAPEPEGDPDGTDQLGDKGKQALERMKADKAAAKKAAAAEKKRADDLAAKVAEFEDRDKSELDKATAKAERLAEQATKATQRAVRAEVKAAAAEFADPEDAAAFLDLSRYADDSGDIDAEAIASDLADLLERKPHLKRATTPEPPKGPKPDPSQGTRKDPPPTDYRTAPRDELKKKLAEYGVRLR
ncbi:hypothetical protein U9R90_05165 [Streptomyces sp. E11-3]|uniref:hypothetical protein n=1 Tax=Streptomyces sp. E11-3 TaxID=3110112 RepID=UPI003980D8A9